MSSAVGWNSEKLLAADFYGGKFLATLRTEWSALGKVSLTSVPKLLLLWKVMGNAREHYIYHVEEESQAGFWTWRVGFPNNWIFAVLSVCQLFFFFYM